MDISTLSLPAATSGGRELSARGSNLQVAARSSDAIAPVIPPEPVIQGEWLARETPRPVPAGEYLRGGVYDMRYAPTHASVPMEAGINRPAINAYLGHTREGVRDASGRGRSVDYFV